MAETPTDVLVAGYQDIDEATKDFEALVALVKDKKVSIEGVILVTHAEDGSVAVQRTGDNLGRKGMGWGGGVGLAVGLFAPPLLASVAVGAVAGRVMGRFAGNKVNKELHDKIGENLPPGSAGIIAIFDDEQRLGVEQALAGALLRSVVQGDKKGMGALKESLAEAMGKFSPDRTVLPIPDPNFGGDDRANARHVRRRLDDQHDAVAAGGRAERVARADRRRRLRQPVDVRRARLDAGDDAGRRAGPQVQRLPRHRAVLAHAGRPADGPQPPHGRLRVDRRASRPVPRLLRERAEGLRSVRPRASGQRLLDRRVRQVASDPRSRPGCSRAVRPLAERVGIRSLLGHPRRRGGPVRPGDHAGQHDHRRPGGQGRRRSTTGRTTSPTRRWAGCTRCAPRTRRSRGSSTTRPGARTRRTRSRSSGARSTAASSTRAGMCCARRPSNGRRRWA